MAPERLVFLDECGFALNLHRLYGWTVGGGRCEEGVPFNKGVNRSVAGAFSLPTAANPSGLWALWQKLGLGAACYSRSFCRKRCYRTCPEEASWFWITLVSITAPHCKRPLNR